MNIIAVEVDIFCIEHGSVILEGLDQGSNLLRHSAGIITVIVRPYRTELKPKGHTRG